MDLKEFLKSYSPLVQSLAFQVCALVHETLPWVVEVVDPPSKIIAFGYDVTYKGLLCAVAPYSNHVNLIFSRGTQLNAPEGLLEGTGKQARHVKIRTLQDIDRKILGDLLIEAAHITN
jgi:hypothetical protein